MSLILFTFLIAHFIFSFHEILFTVIWKNKDKVYRNNHIARLLVLLIISWYLSRQSPVLSKFALSF